tara:strand:- start:26 stop:3391 length:3366 start_codon:yes stop_codon:yes gene_type:complete
MAELNEKQRVFVEGLQKSIDDNTFAPETLNPLQLRAIDKLIKSKVLKSKPLEEIYEERTQAREDLAKQETVAQDPLGAYLGMDESSVPGADFLLSGRSSAVLAGDISASFMAANYMRDKIAEAYKKTDMTGLKLTKNKQFFFEKLANKLPGRFKFLKGAAKLAGRTLDLGERAVRSPLGRGELAVAGAGTIGAGGGSVAYDLMNNAVGPSLMDSLLEDLGNMPKKDIDKLNVVDRAMVEAKNAALFNFGAAALTPLLMASGKFLNFAFGTTGDYQKAIAKFARDNGYEIPLLAAMRDGPLSGLGQSYFKTVGVFPYISRTMDKRMLSAEKVFSKGFLDSNIATIAPIYSHSFLSQRLYNQAVETFKKNVGTIDSAYDKFFAINTVAGDPAILKLTKTLKASDDFLRQNSAQFPDIVQAMGKAGQGQGRQIDFKAILDQTGYSDPLAQFMSFANGVARGQPITFNQYKGMTMMLNQALEQTKYKTVNKSVAAIREALEKDAHGFLKELNVPSLVQNKEIQQRLIELGGGDVVRIMAPELAAARVAEQMAGRIPTGEGAFQRLIAETEQQIIKDGIEITDDLRARAAAKIAKTPQGKEIMDSVINAGSQLHNTLKDANEVFSRIMKFYTGKEGTTAIGALSKFDKTLFTQKTLFNIPGAATLPKDKLFEKVQTAVFKSRSPAALQEFRKMIGAQPGFAGYSAAGEKLYQASVARFMHNAFMSSFRSKPINAGIFGKARVPFSAPFENGAFRSIEADARFANGVDDIYEAMENVGTKQALRSQGGEISSRLTADGLEDVTSIRFGPDDYRDFDGTRFRDILGLDDPTSDVYKFIEEMYGGGKKGADALSHLEDFVEYSKRLTDIPITNSSSFIQRRLTLGGASSLAGVALGFGGSAAASPLAPFVLFATALRAGKILSDPYLLRQINDVLTPKEVEAILKGGKAFGVTQAGVINPKAYLAGLRTKREAFARFMNKAFGDDDDFVPVDPKNIDLERITEYLNKKDVELIKPNFGNNGNNLPASTIYKMYDEEVMQEPNEEEQAEEENFIEGGLIAQNDFNNTFLPEAQANKLEPGEGAPANTAMTMPTVQMPTVTGQVTSQQVADLFPNDPTTIAAARRREAPRG